jgi:membrane-associated PAP2 superfamily phosphatase
MRERFFVFLMDSPAWRSLGLIFSGFLLATLVWDASGLDVWAMNWAGSAQGFALRDEPLWAVWLHDRARSLCLGVYGLLWAWALWPGSWVSLTRGHRLYLMGLVTLCLLLVSGAKHLSLTSCPWDVQDWGGVAHYVSHWRWGVSDGGDGRCFPGGHVSSVAAFAPWVVALWAPLPGQEAAKRWAGAAAGVWVLGVLLLGLTQTLRGAHYPSHTAWTAIICGAVALLGWGWLHVRHARLLVAKV